MIAPDEFAEVIEKITYGEHWKSLCQLNFM